jgi:hypothetical protein
MGEICFVVLARLSSVIFFFFTFCRPTKQRGEGGMSFLFSSSKIALLRLSISQLEMMEDVLLCLSSYPAVL